MKFKMLIKFVKTTKAHGVGWKRLKTTKQLTNCEQMVIDLQLTTNSRWGYIQWVKVNYE